MKRYLTLLLTIFATTLLFAQKGADNKISTWLQESLRRDTNHPRRAEEAKPMLTTTFLRVTEQMTNEMLQQYECKVYARLGDICIVTIPLNRLKDLAQNDQVLRIEASPSAHTTMDLVPGQVNTLPVYQHTTQHEAFTGKGVVLGIMDIGFDLTHPNFFSDVTRNHYRIKAFWDQLAPQDNSSGKTGSDASESAFPVGRDYTSPEDILALGCATDGRKQYHGTHTTGIAAGSGYDTPYRGIAFESDIALVANAVTEDTVFIDAQDYNLYTSATDALGFKYLFDYAEQQGLPCVASFSEGYTPYLDNDDLLYDEFLGRLTGPGRILVASAGNESLNPTYFHKPQGMEAAGSFLYLFRKKGAYRLLTDGSPTLLLKHYTDGHEVDRELSLSMNYELWKGESLQDTMFIDKDTLAVNVTSHTSDLIPGQRMYYIALSSNRSINGLGHLALIATGNDCYVQVFGSSSSALTNSGIDTRWNAAQIGHNVLAPGALSTPICVGSTSYRMSYVNTQGATISYAYGGEVGKWSTFSSIGPTMCGTTKPDVCAPGNYVFSSYSSFYQEEHPEETFLLIANSDVDGRSYPWASLLGTSMSTPVVAGAIALWLEAKPTLTKEEIMAVIARTSRHPEESLSYPNNVYGYGEIDVYRGLLDILGITAIQEVSQHHPQHVTINAHDGMLHLAFSETSLRPLTLRIYSTAGALLHQQQLAVDQREIKIPLPVTGKGIYVVQLNGAPSMTGSQLIRIPR